MAVSNKHIVEVLFAMWFDPNINEWDSTYFGKFNHYVNSLGYTERQEQKQVELKFEITHNPNPEVSDGNIKMIFKDPTKNQAIVLSDHFISFHKLYPYENWDELIKKVVDPALDIYKNHLNLGKGLREVQCLYLNKHIIPKQESISSVYKFWPFIEDGFETNILFQTKFDLPEDVSVQLKLNGSAATDGTRETFFECSTFVKAKPDEDYHVLAQKAHDNANSIYDKLMQR